MPRRTRKQLVEVHENEDLVRLEREEEYQVLAWELHRQWRDETAEALQPSGFERLSELSAGSGIPGNRSFCARQSHKKRAIGRSLCRAKKPISLQSKVAE
jgi:hypothetical protein